MLDNGEGIGAIPFLIGFAAGFSFYVTHFHIWGERLWVWPRRGHFERHRRSTRVMLSLFRPTFITRVFRGTEWPPVAVGCLLLALLAAALTAIWR